MIKRGPFRRKGVEEYVKRMSLPREKAVYDSTVTNLLEKAGYEIPEDPASVYDPEQLWTQLDRFSEKTTFVEDEFIESAVKRAYRAFGYRESYGPKLIPLQTETEIIEAIKLEKHAGVYFSDKLSAWPRAWTRRIDVLEGTKKPNPCLAGVRTQRNNKTRLVWGYPLEMTMLESAFAKPLIDVYKEIRSPMPYAIRRYAIGARLEFTLQERNRVALDFSKFDSSVPAHLIKVAFRILRTWFDDFEDYDEVGWREIKKYFLNTPIVMIDGNLYTGKTHGVPSGSFFTQLIDSIVNYIIITAAMSKFDMHPHEMRIHVLGDDSVFSTNADVSLKTLATYFKTKGFNLNIEKSSVVGRNSPIEFIGFLWDKGTPSKDINKVLLSMSQPEKWRQKGLDKKKEFERAYRLILEMVTLGANLYEVLRKVQPSSPSRHIYYKPEGKTGSGYQAYSLEHFPTKEWRNVATGLWI